jgi:hypothetical protein
VSTIKLLFSWLSRALGDGDNPSSSRLIAVPTLLSIYLVPLTVWAYLSFSEKKLLDVPMSLVAFVGAVSGPLLVFVNSNKKLEVTANTPLPKDTP